MREGARQPVSTAERSRLTTGRCRSCMCRAFHTAAGGSGRSAQAPASFADHRWLRPRLGRVTADAPPPDTSVLSDVSDAPAARTPRRRRARLIAARVLLVVVGAITLMTLVLFIGMRRDDSEIDRHRGTATATVLSISALRTGIEYIDGSGVAVRPRDGVLYPGLLKVGQRFKVDYSTADPTVVRVAGRTAAVGNVGLAITVVGTWLIGGAVSWALRRPPGRRRSPAR